MCIYLNMGIPLVLTYIKHLDLKCQVKDPQGQFTGPTIQIMYVCIYV